MKRNRAGDIDDELLGIARRAQNGSDVFRIVPRIEQNQTGVFILGIADDQRDLPVGPRGVGGEYDTEYAAKGNNPCPHKLTHNMTSACNVCAFGDEPDGDRLRLQSR